MANGNGTVWTKGLLAGVSLCAGLIIGAVSVGVTFGGIKAHVDDTVVHEAPTVKEARIRRVIDREVKPSLESMQRQLDRIENKLEHLP